MCLGSLQREVPCWGVGSQARRLELCHSQFRSDMGSQGQDLAVLGAYGSISGEDADVVLINRRSFSKVSSRGVVTSRALFRWRSFDDLVRSHKISTTWGQSPSAGRREPPEPRHPESPHQVVQYFGRFVFRPMVGVGRICPKLHRLMWGIRIPSIRWPSAGHRRGVPDRRSSLRQDGSLRVPAKEGSSRAGALLTTPSTTDPSLRPPWGSELVSPNSARRSGPDSDENRCLCL